MNPEVRIRNLDVYVTGKCNYRCRYCYGENDQFDSMDMHTYQNALAFGHYLRAENIQLCGGEPLVCPEFESFVTLARQKDFDVILRTNGILIHKRLEFIAKSCKWVGISLDGTKAYNALMRTPRTAMSAEEQFELPIRAIFDLKRINPGIKIILATLVSRKNYLGLSELANYLARNKVPIDKWKIYEFITDKFRSAENHSEFEMEEDVFFSAVQMLPDSINGAPIQIQSAHTERVSANCLIVYQNGDINLMGKHYGNINTDAFGDIVRALTADNALSVIYENKETTYD